MKKINLGKKYNTQTKGFKIDIFIRGIYVYSTDMYKTLAAAKTNYLDNNPGVNKRFIKAEFNRV